MAIRNRNGAFRMNPPAERPTDRLAWLWLALGALLLPFVGVQTVLPPATWLAPLLLLRFTRTQRPWIALPVILVVQYATTVVAFRAVFPPPMLYVVSVAGALAVVVYAADALLAPRLTGIARTLVFPIAATLFDYALGLTPLGSGGATAYSQSANLPLIQMASVTGIWGISFLLAWFASAVNAVWEQAARGRVAWKEAGLFGAVLLAVLFFGSARVAFATAGARDDSPTVRVASLAMDSALRHGLSLPVQEVATGAPALRAEARAAYAPLLDDLFTRTRQAAQAGAQIVAWSEGAALVLKEDEPALLEQAQALAHEEGIYLQVALVAVLQADARPYGENRALLIDPTGQVVWDYFKAVHPFEDNAVFAPGPGVIPVVETPYGRLATVICFDADFPALLRQAGQANVDILLAPSNDWQPVDVLHAQVHRLRAAEYGFSLVRPTGNGITLVTDPLGRVLAEADYFRTPRLTLITDVPRQGMGTLYTQVGDLFVALCAAGLALLVGMAFLRRRAPAAVGGSTPLPA